MKINRDVLKSLGVSEAGLRVLMRAVANDGKASGDGFGHASGGARTALYRQGHVEEDPAARYHAARITDSGREIVRRARAMGV